MGKFVLFMAAVVILYSCIEISAKESPTKNESSGVFEVNKNGYRVPPDQAYRVRSAEAEDMRGRRGNDTALVKISAKDLQSLLTNPVAESDSFVFYFVKYKANSKEEQDRFKKKMRNHPNWQSLWLKEVMKRPSSLLVGFAPGDKQTGGRVFGPMPRSAVEVYDFGVVCPPPPDCNCVISDN